MAMCAMPRTDYDRRYEKNVHPVSGYRPDSNTHASRTCRVHRVVNGHVRREVTPTFVVTRNAQAYVFFFLPLTDRRIFTKRFSVFTRKIVVRFRHTSYRATGFAKNTFVSARWKIKCFFFFKSIFSHLTFTFKKKKTIAVIL